jgi:two-component system CheB/CheR fusion protein
VREQDARQQNTAPRGVVGIGASAGGLEALQQFLNYLPVNTDLAYVIIQHLSPDYKSLLQEILSKYTKMPVLQAKDGMVVARNTIYIIPPKYNMELAGDRLHLSVYDHAIINHPIDIFFRSLAVSYRQKSAAVILSGTGSDGTNGIKSIKEENGLIIVQSPESSRFDGMPRSAIATGFADLVLPPEAIAMEMTHISGSFFSRTSEHGEGLKPTDETMLTKIFSILKSITNVNYTYYKQTTILRRIERRMVVTHKTDLEKYVDYLGANPDEARLLSREVLIGVTSFFRDPDYFAALKENVVKPLLQESKGGSEPVRVWVAGCSTGEEAYSVAILFMEAMEELNIRHELKIFATDLDTESIAIAGRGAYGESIASDVSINRLSKFFTKRKNTYVVNHDLRKLIIFSPHNVFQDPPFGRLDLICCRNLLIYFQNILQKDMFNIFHMALKDKGYLFLGKSEAINNNYEDVFLPVCAQEKIFRHNADGHAPMPNTVTYTMPLLNNPPFMRDVHNEEDEPVSRDNDLYLKTLETFMPACILVDEKNKIRHLFGDCSNYLHMPTGNFTADVFNLLTPDLRISVSTALKASRERSRRLTYLDVPMNGEKTSGKISLTAAPINNRSGAPSGLTAIVFMDNSKLEPLKEGQHYDVDRIAAQRIADLEQELNKTKDELKHSIAELESVNEELQAANEELLTANEELQSSNEELQSVNEELYTVNSEYQQKAGELSGLNDDLNNFLATNLIGIIFIDDQFRLRKFTSYIMKEFNVLPQDIGRPLQYIAYNFMNVDLLQLSHQVVTNQVPLEQDIVSVNGKPYFLRIAPFRTEDKKMLGLVMTFVDVTRKYDVKQQVASMEQALERAQTINSQKDSFMSRMSHDMRTPLHTIQGLVFLSQEDPNLSKSLSDNLLKIKDASQYLLDIINDVLDSSMIASNRMKIKEAPCQEDILLQEAEDMILLQAEKAKVVFQRSITGSADHCLMLDKTHVLQILVNLLNNAIKFTPENGKVEFHTVISEPAPGRVRHVYTISDTGCGMSKDFLDKMYQPFEQGNMEQHSAAPGVGLGLHIVKNLVNLLGGELECRSEVGRGTTFTVTLTYNAATKAQQEALQKNDTTDFSRLQDKKVLLCDDHEVNLAITRAILEDKGIKVVTAVNGQEAVQNYMESAIGEFDAILMDIRMPIMDGLQATIKIRSCQRADAKKIPILALTANALDEEEQVCLDAGMNARLVKPLNTQDLYKALLQYMA